MKFYKLAFFIILAASFSTGYVCADVTECSINIEYVDLMEAPSIVTIQADGSNPPVVSSDTSFIKYSHNSEISKRITATVIPDPGVDANITLQISLDGEQSVTLIESGIPLENVGVWDGIAAGGYIKSVNWDARVESMPKNEKTINCVVIFTAGEIE